MKILNKEEIKAIAADVFGRYTKAEKVAVTSDGMAFITDESENAVSNHSKRNPSGKELKITTFTRDEVSETKVKKGKAEPNKGKTDADEDKTDGGGDKSGLKTEV